jgi:ABC-type sugar transport system ATPase subunit
MGAKPVLIFYDPVRGGDVNTKKSILEGVFSSIFIVSYE